MSQSPVTPRTTPAVTRRLETPAARPTPTHTDNPLRTTRMSQSPVTPRTTPAVTRPLETPTARAAPTRTDNPLRTPTCTSQSPVTPRTTLSTIDSPVEQRARGTLETPRIPARIAAPKNNSNTNTREEKDCTQTTFQITCVLDREHFRNFKGKF